VVVAVLQALKQQVVMKSMRMDSNALKLMISSFIEEQFQVTAEIQDVTCAKLKTSIFNHTSSDASPVISINAQHALQSFVTIM